MPKNIIEDMRPPERRSIRSIKISPTRKHSSEAADSVPAALPAEEPARAPSRASAIPVHRIDDDMADEAPIRARAAEEPEPEYAPERERAEAEDDGSWSDIEREIVESDSRAPRYILWGLAGIGVAVLIIAIYGFFSYGATVTVAARSESAAFSTTTMVAEVPAAADAHGTLAYQVVTLMATSSQPVSAVSQKTSPTQASGKIVIYNNYSSAPQTLIKNTRFETSDGKIYRIHSAVVVPGKKSGTPGSVAVTVYADQPGAVYNIGLSDFTIPGFMNDAGRYQGFYGRSQTAMTGGSDGLVRIADPALAFAARKALDASLYDQLIGTLHSQASSTAVIFDSLVSVTYQAADAGASMASSTASTVPVTEVATLIAPVFDHDQLASTFARRGLPDYDGKGVSVQGLSSLYVTGPGASVGSLASQGKPISFTITGSVDFSWLYSKADLAARLAGKSKDDLPAVLQEFPAISKAKAVIRPFWKSVFPTDPGAITIEDGSLSS